MWRKLHLLNEGRCARIRTSFEKTNRRLAQLVRALGRHPRGHQFESGTAYQSQSSNPCSQESFCRLVGNYVWINFFVVFAKKLTLR